MSASNPIDITMGDPSGVGPEIICKALADLTAEARQGIAVIGTRSILERADQLSGSGLRFTAPETAGAGEIGVIDIAIPGGGQAVDGEVTPAGGAAAYAYVAKATELAMAGRIGCIVTAPLNKAALNAAGHDFDGHTGLLAHLTGAKASFMLLTSERLATIHVSTHVSMAEAIERVTRERVLAVIRAGDAHLRRFGSKQPKIAVAGLNPHCGEGGLFGREDQEQIVPAVAAACAEGIDAHGPIPGDSVFLRASRGEFDLVVAQYHDQGHAPIKLIAFDTTVNVTLGLPIDRCSVDHGTAFDIAWKGTADHTNMKAAIAYGRRLAATRAPAAEAAPAKGAG